jgi:hypothetical protein
LSAHFVACGFTCVKDFLRGVDLPYSSLTQVNPQAVVFADKTKSIMKTQEKYICKGCGEEIYKYEYEEGKGWCGLCEMLDYDFLDKEKYPDQD